MSKPLTFIGQKLVLEFLDPDLRFELYQKCPRIRAAHRATPLKVQSFNPKNFEIHVNSTVFKLGIIRIYKGTKVPKWVRDERQKGGAQFDLGWFGDPNDAEVQQRAKLDRAPSNKKRTRNFKAQEELRALLPRVNYHKETKADADDLEFKINELQREIRIFNERLAISNWKFAKFIQLTTVTKTAKSIERVCYGVSLQNAMDYLLDSVLVLEKKIQVNYDLGLLGIISRNFTIKIGRLDIDLEIEHGTVQSVTFPHMNNTKLRGKFKTSFENLKKPPLLFALRLRWQISRGGTEEEETLEAMKALADTEEIRQEIERKAFPLTFNIQYKNTLIRIEIAIKIVILRGQPAKEFLMFTLTGNLVS